MLSSRPQKRTEKQNKTKLHDLLTAGGRDGAGTGVGGGGVKVSGGGGGEGGCKGWGHRANSLFAHLRVLNSSSSVEA